jgi:hypothetical protein
VNIALPQDLYRFGRENVKRKLITVMSQRLSPDSAVIKESLSNQTGPRGETWRARAQERKGCFQALPAGISTYGEDGVVDGKAKNH